MRNSRYGCYAMFNVTSHFCKRNTLQATQALQMSLIHQQQVIGQGTFGSVFLVRNRNQEPVAMKVVKKASAQKPGDMEREFQAGKILEHKHIAKVSETYQDENNWYMVMEYIDGENLFHFVQRTLEENNGDLKLSQTVIKRMFKQLVSAMEYSHKKGVAHLDLKLENIMIQDNNAKIIDFGLCQIQSDITEKCSRFVGSPDYICPEILQRQAYRPDKADVWSLGVILYILLTGEMPFSRRDRKACQKGEDNHPEVMWDSDNVIPKKAKNLIERMLAVNPEERPTISEVKKHPWLSRWSI